MVISHSYQYGDEFVEYQFDPFHRIIYDFNDLNTLLFSMLRNQKILVFFFLFKKKKINKVNIYL